MLRAALAAILFYALTLCSQCNASPVSIFVGSYGSSSYSGDGSQATSARIRQPTGLFTNTAGSLFIGDPSSAVIRIVYANGIVDTFAGGGSNLLTSNNIPATDAILGDAGYPYGDNSSNIYFSETSSNRLRKVSSSGIITTLSGSSLGFSGSSGDGGSADNANLDTPRALFVDPEGLYLFIADSGNYKIRKIVLSSNIISTFAGKLYVMNNKLKLTIIFPFCRNRFKWLRCWCFQNIRKTWSYLRSLG